MIFSTILHSRLYKQEFIPLYKTQFFLKNVFKAKSQMFMWFWWTFPAHHKPFSK